jgi:hypothetical protein
MIDVLNVVSSLLLCNKRVGYNQHKWEVVKKKKLYNWVRKRDYKAKKRNRNL